VFVAEENNSFTIKWPSLKAKKGKNPFSEEKRLVELTLR
jgi:hypothetical protein